MKAVRRPPPGMVQEHEFEAQPGLPEALPSTERIVWQGAPDWKRLARRAFHLRKLMVYFAGVLAVRAAFLAADGAPAGEVLRSLAMLAPLALAALGMLAAIAWFSARTTVYTITTRRVVMRIGIVLTLTFNIPLRRIAAADLRADDDGIGDIPLTLADDESIAWVHLWPHCRPLRFARPQPMLRSVPGAADVARRLGEVWAAETGRSATPAPTAADTGATLPAGEPVLAR